jgi:4-hydroxy-tetrahydrodipicolinate reductase
MRVLQLGFGTVGRENVRQLLERGHTVAGIVDTRSDLSSEVDRAFPSLVSSGVAVASDLAHCLAAARPDVVLQATSFDETAMIETVRSVALAGADLVTINGLAFVQRRYPLLFSTVDAIARNAGIRVLGAGLIPGFLSDALPAFLTGACARVDAVEVRRVSDFSGWGPDVMGRYGFGVDQREFEAKLATGEIGLFRALWQSADMIAATLGWNVIGEKEWKEPLLSERQRRGAQVSVAAGTVGGFKHAVQLEDNRGRHVRIEVHGFIDPQGADEQPATSVRIVGQPGMELTVAGDISRPDGALAASSARMVNAIARLSSAQPGLRTTTDLPTVVCA